MELKRIFLSLIINSKNLKEYPAVKVGRTHKWNYDKGDWKEKKVTPDKW